MKIQNIRADELIKKTVGDPYRNPRQIEFLKAQTRYVAYGGAKGGGKSFAVRYKAITLALNYPGIKILLIRRSLVELRRNHTRDMKKIFNKWPKSIQPKYNDDEKTFYFLNGSIIELSYCDSDSDADNYNGVEYDVIFIDEATQIPEDWFRIFDSCIRGVNGFPKRIYLTCNPGGVGHDWVKKLFVDRDGYRKHENPEDFTFIPALVWDNDPLFDDDEGYKMALKRYLSEHGLKEPDKDAIWYAKNCANYVTAIRSQPYPRNIAWLEGRWDLFVGQYFVEFDQETHTCEPFQLKSHWRRTVSLDYGLDMLAVLWFATDEQGHTWVYRELNRPDLAISLAAEAIRKETPADEHIDAYYAPPDLWNRRQDTGKSAAEIFAECGVPLVKAGNDRVQGWLNVKEWLKPVGAEKKPHLVIFRTCKELIKHIPLLQHDENKTNDVATEPHYLTHNTDALRYWCSRRQLSAEVKEIPPENQWAHENKGNDDYFDGGEVTESYLLGGYS
jgi:phage terminase large subunit